PAPRARSRLRWLRRRRPEGSPRLVGWLVGRGRSVWSARFGSRDGWRARFGSRDGWRARFGSRDGWREGRPAARRAMGLRRRRMAAARWTFWALWDPGGPTRGPDTVG